MALHQLLTQLDQLMVEGRFIEAIQQFFHPDVKCHSDPTDAIYGIDKKVETMRDFLSDVGAIEDISISSQAVGDYVTITHVKFDFNQRNGNKLVFDELIRRFWKNDKVIDEKYYMCHGDCSEAFVEQIHNNYSLAYPVEQEETPEAVVSFEAAGAMASAGAMTISITTSDLFDASKTTTDEAEPAPAPVEEESVASDTTTTSVSIDDAPAATENIAASFEASMPTEPEIAFQDTTFFNFNTDDIQPTVEQEPVVEIEANTPAEPEITFQDTAFFDFNTTDDQPIVEESVPTASIVEEHGFFQFVPMDGAEEATIDDEQNTLVAAEYTDDAAVDTEEEDTAVAATTTEHQTTPSTSESFVLSSEMTEGLGAETANEEENEMEEGGATNLVSDEENFVQAESVTAPEAINQEAAPSQEDTTDDATATSSAAESNMGIFSSSVEAEQSEVATASEATETPSTAFFASADEALSTASDAPDDDTTESQLSLTLFDEAVEETTTDEAETPVFSASTKEVIDPEIAVRAAELSTIFGTNTIAKQAFIDEIIPDDFGIPLISRIHVTEQGKIEQMGVDLDIEHPFIQDLVVRMRAPSGKEVTLHNREGVVDNEIQNIKRFYDADYFTPFQGEDMEGDWEVRITDNSKRDVGKLVQWGIYIDPVTNTFAMEEILTTEADGGDETFVNSIIGEETIPTPSIMASTSDTVEEMVTAEVPSEEIPPAVSSLFTFMDDTAGTPEATVEEEAAEDVVEKNEEVLDAGIDLISEVETAPAEPTDVIFEFANTTMPAADEMEQVAQQSMLNLFESLEEESETAQTPPTEIETEEEPEAAESPTEFEPFAIVEPTVLERLAGEEVLHQELAVNEVIPDHVGALVSRMRFLTQRVVQQLDLDVDIAHPAPSDLVLSLIAPSGKAVVLHNREAGNEEGLVKYYSPDFFEVFRGEKIPGDWKLEVADKAITDVGKLNSWSLRIQPGEAIVLEDDEEDEDVVETVVVENTTATVEETIPTAVTSSGELRGADVQVIEKLVELPILDNQEEPLTTSISVSTTGQIKDLGLFVDIEHPFCTDLQIVLVAPSGKAVIVYDREGGFSNNMKHYYNSTFFPEFIGERIEGNWTLKVYDLSPEYAGKLNFWRLYVLPA